MAVWFQIKCTALHQQLLRSPQPFSSFTSQRDRSNESQFFCSTFTHTQQQTKKDSKALATADAFQLSSWNWRCGCVWMQLDSFGGDLFSLTVCHHCAWVGYATALRLWKQSSLWHPGTSTSSHAAEVKVSASLCFKRLVQHKTYVRMEGFMVCWWLAAAQKTQTLSWRTTLLEHRVSRKHVGGERIIQPSWQQSIY